MPNALNVMPGWYRMRGGGVAVVQSIRHCVAWGFMEDDPGREYGWLLNGRVHAAGCDNPWDLVEHIEEPQG